MMEDSIGKLISTSHFYETPPWGFNSDNPFINVSVIFQTDKSPTDVLSDCLMIEKKLGRTRKKSNPHQKYEDRTIDIDIALWENKIINEDYLIVPHKHLQERQFVLIPLDEIAPDWEITDFPVKKVSQALIDLQNKEGNIKIEKLENIDVI